MSIVIKPKVKASQRYKKFLELSSVLLEKPLTPLEINILDELYNSNGGILTSDIRKHIKDVLEISPDHLNNYIKILRGKKIIVGDTINPSLMISIPEATVFSLQIDMQVQI